MEGGGGSYAAEGGGELENIRSVNTESVEIGGSSTVESKRTGE